MDRSLKHGKSNNSILKQDGRRKGEMKNPCIIGDVAIQEIYDKFIKIKNSNKETNIMFNSFTN